MRLMSLMRGCWLALLLGALGVPAGTVSEVTARNRNAEEPAWHLLEDFEGSAPLRTWLIGAGASSGHEVKDDGSGRNRALNAWQTGSPHDQYAKLHLGEHAIPPGETRTFFYRIRIDERDGVSHHQFGLSNDLSPSRGNEGIQIQQVVRFDDAPEGEWHLRQFDGPLGEHRVHDLALDKGVWHNVWVVADNEKHTYQVYVNTDERNTPVAAEESDRVVIDGVDTFGFKQQRPMHSDDSLEVFHLHASNDSHPDVILHDDLYISSGTNLSNPRRQASRQDRRPPRAGARPPRTTQPPEEGADRPSGDRPNIVVIYTDDMAYGDLSSYNADDLQTPRLDEMAEQGVRFTNAYNSSSACSTSRGAILTGSYHQRLSIRKMFRPQSDRGLHPDEITIADMLGEVGYVSAALGKWHLGNAPNLRPNAQGFDLFYGIPVSHDYNYPDGQGMPFFENEQIIDRQIPDELYTQRLTDRALKFIEQNQDDPFFVYLAHPMPHVPLAVTDGFRNRAERGLYGDVMEELDHNVGRIVDKLETLELDDNTIVLFLSDNGPWESYGNHAGVTGDLRGGKRNTFEGGIRTPLIAWGPGLVREGVVEDTPAMTIDFLPTFAHMAGGQVPEDRVIDGVDIRALLLDGDYPEVDPDRPLMFYDYASNALFSMRMGPWKLHFPHRHQVVDWEGQDGQRGGYRWEDIELSLFNLEQDPSESTNVADEHPEVVAQMQEAADQYRNDLGDSLQDINPGPDVRPLGTAER